MFTWVEISKNAIEYNIKQFRKLLHADVLFMPTIKANAYGHGFLEIAKICQQSPAVDRICVVNSEEAWQLVKNGFTEKPIQVLSFFDFDDRILLKLAKKQVVWPLYTLEQVKILNKVGDRVKRKIKVHLKIDTGASRIGVRPVEMLEFVGRIKKFKSIEIEGVWSHFSSSEEDSQTTLLQLDIFNRAVLELNKIGVNPPIKHISCSASTILYPASHFNAVRVGLGIYGLHPSDQTKTKIDLKPVLSWQTKIIQLKSVPSGAKISYGGTYTTNRPTTLAVLPVGYYDGFDRDLSNRGHVLVKGLRCSILGRICMNLTIIDVTGIDGLKIGEKVTLVGSQGKQKITVDDIAKLVNSISYEIVDRINPLLPRIVV